MVFHPRFASLASISSASVRPVVTVWASDWASRNASSVGDWPWGQSGRRDRRRRSQPGGRPPSWDTAEQRGNSDRAPDCPGCETPLAVRGTRTQGPARTAAIAIAASGWPVSSNPVNDIGKSSARSPSTARHRGHWSWTRHWPPLPSSTARRSVRRRDFTRFDGLKWENPLARP